MGHERGIEAMREASWRERESGGVPPRRRKRRNKGAIWRRRILALVLLVVLLLAVLFVVARVRDCGGSGGGSWAGTWQKANGEQVIIAKGEGVDGYTVQFRAGGPVSSGQVRDDILYVPHALGVKGLDLRFTLKDDGAVLVETFSNGSTDELKRAP
jgi:hypothetical protein